MPDRQALLAKALTGTVQHCERRLILEMAFPGTSRLEDSSWGLRVSASRSCRDSEAVAIRKGGLRSVSTIVFV